MSHFLDRLTYFKQRQEAFSGTHGVVTTEDRTWEDAYRQRYGDCFYALREDDEGLGRMARSTDETEERKPL